MVSASSWRESRRLAVICCSELESSERSFSESTSLSSKMIEESEEPIAPESTRSASKRSARSSWTESSDAATARCATKSSDDAARLVRADVLGEDALDVGGGDRGAQRQLPRPVVRFHEQQGLDLLLARGARGQRDADVQREVEEHRPEEGVAPLAQAVQPEERVGVEEARGGEPAEGAALGQDPGLEERRDDQGVEPDREARAQAGDGPGAAAALPVQAEEKRRGEQGDGLEGLQADVHQAVELPDRDREEVAEVDHGEDDQPLDGEDDGREPAVLVEPDQRRHHDAVHGHGAQGERLDDDHARRRREAAEKDHQGEVFHPLAPAGWRARSSPRPAAEPVSSSPAKAIGSTKMLIRKR